MTTEASRYNRRPLEAILSRVKIILITSLVTSSTKEVTLISLTTSRRIIVSLGEIGEIKVMIKVEATSLEVLGITLKVTTVPMVKAVTIVQILAKVEAIILVALEETIDLFDLYLVN
jgi:hypothetical protein